uniref:Uncharacterized protein n=1 Tax=viral metagenome TaxID=1070528 RepID=A0A6C0JST2_9ZZZZ
MSTLQQQNNASTTSKNMLYLWPGVMSGGYTSGCAFAIASSREDAIDQLVLSLSAHLFGHGTIKMYTGTWQSQIELSDVTNEARRIHSTVAVFHSELENGTCIVRPLSKPTAFFQGGGD